MKSSIQLNEIYLILNEVGDMDDISISSISEAIKSKLLSGKRYTKKRVTHVALERFTDENMLYTQLFINYLSSKDHKEVKFFDEAGVKTLDIGTSFYGDSPSGEHCVEMIGKIESPNATLSSFLLMAQNILTLLTERLT